jgi:hypothetical protein
MSVGLAPVYPVDSSHSETPGYMGAMMQPTEQFAKAANRNTMKPKFAAGEGDLSDDRLIARAREAYDQAKTYMEANVASGWERSYKAYRNQHFEGSKYNSAEFKNRSKLFRPKTMAAVRKQLMACTQALFASSDVLSIEAQDETNKEQRASADLKQRLINYRLSKKSGRNGLRWFQQALGARFNSTVAGLVISKQSWRYVLDEDDEILEDRPDITIFEPENVLLDPNAHWIDPGRTGAYVILRYPSTAEDALVMIKNQTGVPWRENITLDMLQARGQSSAGDVSVNTRQARQGGSDPKQDSHGTYKTIWLHENFMRISGVEYVFWTVGNDVLLSKPQKLKDAYPHLHGDRPVTVGYSQLEPHKVYPISPVESWQPLQQEANDVANLRLDHMKMLVSRPMFVKRGAKVDLQQVQRRGPGSIVLVQSQEDVQPEEMPDVPQSAYVETNYINADFDDLAGGFSTGSVQTNRSLNETVGGMKLMANDANNIIEFDLTVFVETWVEPVLWHLVKLEEYYENDQTVLAICGRQAGLLERFGFNYITDELLKAETTLTVNVGVGSATSPQEKVNRFFAAAEGAGKLLAPYWQQGILPPLIPKQREIVDTVFGGAGFHDAAGRFFHPGDDDKEFAEAQQRQQQGPPPDPEKQAKAQAIQQKAEMDAQLAMQKAQQEAQLHALKLQIEQQKAEMKAIEMQMDLAMQQQEFELEQALRQEQAALQSSIQANEAAFRASEQAYGLQLKGHEAKANVEAMRAKTSLIGQPKPGQTDAKGKPVKPSGKPYQPNIPDAPQPMMPGAGPQPMPPAQPPMAAEPAPPAAQPMNPAAAAEAGIMKRLTPQLEAMTQTLVAIGERLAQPQEKADGPGAIRANRQIADTLGSVNKAMNETREAIARTADALEGTAGALAAIKGQQEAEAEILERGPDGKATKVRKGNITYRVERQGDRTRMIPLA